MNTPFDDSATLELLMEVQLLRPDFSSRLEPRPTDKEPLGLAPDVVGCLRAHKEKIRAADQDPTLSVREHNLNTQMMIIISNLILLELEKAFPLEEGKHILWTGGEVGKKP